MCRVCKVSAWSVGPVGEKTDDAYSILFFAPYNPRTKYYQIGPFWLVCLLGKTW